MVIFFEEPNGKKHLYGTTFGNGPDHLAKIDIPIWWVPGRDGAENKNFWRFWIQIEIRLKFQLS